MTKGTNWEESGYRLFGMRDGYLMNYTMGTSESIEEELQLKGSWDCDYWIVSKDDTIDFYTTSYNPLEQGLSIKVKKEKTVKGFITKDKIVEPKRITIFHGKRTYSFMNYKIEEIK